MTRDYIGALVKEADDAEQSGVKGMKWGVRKDVGHEGEKAKTKQIAKLDKKYDKSLSGIGGFVKVNNAIANRINPRLDTLNAKPEYQGDLTKNPELHKKYQEEYKKDLETSLNEVMSEIGTNASGTKKLQLEVQGEGLDIYWSGSMKDLQHDDLDEGFVIIPEFNENGQIVGQTIGPKTLAHSGVKGMKWGVRKDAPSVKLNEHGEASVEGGSRRARKALAESVQAHPERHGLKRGPESSAESYARLLNQAKKEGANSLTDDELRFVTQRGNAINQVNRLNEKKPGWVAQLAKTAVQQQTNKQIQSLSNDLSKKYIDTSKIVK